MTFSRFHYLIQVFEVQFCRDFCKSSLIYEILNVDYHISQNLENYKVKCNLHSGSSAVGNLGLAKLIDTRHVGNREVRR